MHPIKKYTNNFISTMYTHACKGQWLQRDETLHKLNKKNNLIIYHV